jgi:peptidoglycan-N-acetylglucosamine deacetylase
VDLRLCAVSVDLDALGHYFDIHGLTREPGAEALGYELALGRMGAWAEIEQIPLTLFAVGADLEREAAATVIRVLARRGHAVENHSYGHRYDLTRLPREEMAREVERGAAIIERVTGRRPRAFRAPGYTVNDALFDVLDEAGVDLDSSVFPCPPYYLTKVAVVGGMALRGQHSRSVLDRPWVMGAPSQAYRPGKSWWAPASAGEGRRFLELPIQVTPDLRLPFYGQVIGILGARGAAAMARACVGQELVNLELHAIDFLDRSEGLAALGDHQPELRVPLGERLDALSAAVDVLRSEGYAFVRLDEAAERLSPR